MKANLPIFALAFVVGLLGAASAQAQPEGQPCAPEPTDQLVAYGDHVSPCTIGQVGDSDLFRFQGVVGEVVSVRVTDQAGGSGIPSCTLELLRPVGTLVTLISGNTACEIRTTLDASGLFTARVSETNNDSLMTFALEIDRLVPFSNTAISINPGVTFIGERIDPHGDADLFVFNGVNGDVVSLRGTDQAGGSGIPSISLELFRPDGTLAASAGGNTTAIIDTALDQTGVFTLRVTEVANDSVMTYNVDYQCLVGSCPSFHKLTVARAGAGAVTSSPVGIDCGTDCSERYFVGTVVTLAANPGAAWAFSSWGGNADCADGVVTMTAGISCVATFVPLTTPLVTLDKTSLRFAAATNGAAFVSQTAAQVVRLMQIGTGTATWTATSNQPWLQVSPASGSGSANLSISVVSVGGLPVGSAVTGAITLTLTGASNTAGPIAVTLILIPNGTTARPFGFVDTPLDSTTGATGAIPFTGWALDDVEVARVMVCRAAFGGEVAPLDPNCGGAAQIFVGFAVFIDGARPDVAGLNPTYPLFTRAGWGFMVLTNMLPNQGNGTYVFYLHAEDRDGQTTLLGTRTLTCANASATKPFGTIDTPSQGGPASGAGFINFGWALTPQPKVIPIDGSTITVIVDGAPLGPVDYNHERPDIETLFPGFQNTAGANGAVGFRAIDTTTLTNGLHTISWTVTDSLGVTEGIGSRFFTVTNGSSAPVTAAVEGAASSRVRATAAIIGAAPRDDAPVLARRGWNLEGPWRWYGVGGAGRAVIRGEEVDRFELALGEHAGEHYTGHVRVGEALAPLPIGSQLDATTGQFTWAPGVGFVGRYDLVFVRWAGPRAVARHEVRVILAPKGSGHVGVQVAIDVPRSRQAVEQPFLLAGWAADLDAARGTGIDTLHVWAYPAMGGAPVFLGTPRLGGARPDVAAVHGDEFHRTGFGLTVHGLSAGDYDLAVFPWSNVTGGFAPPNIVRVTVR